MSFLGALPRCHDLLTRPASGDTALGGRLRAVAERRHVVVDWPQVRVTVVIARTNMVDTIGASSTTHVTDPAVVAQDPLPLGVP
jgi:hypothetical protein